MGIVSVQRCIYQKVKKQEFLWQTEWKYLKCMLYTENIKKNITTSSKFHKNRGNVYTSYLMITGPPKWISSWKGYGTLNSRCTEFLNSRCSRMAKTLTFWLWCKPFNGFCFKTLSFLPFLFLLPKKRGITPTPLPKKQPLGDVLQNRYS